MTRRRADHGERGVLDRDDLWEPESLDDAEDAGVLWPVLRNVGLLVGICLAAVWVLAEVAGGFMGNAPGVQQARQQGVAGKPPAPSGNGDYELTIPAGANGHFLVNAMADGRPVRFLVDTGATGILLTQEDARAVGIHPASLTYSDRIRTANGDIAAAKATIREIRIAGLIVDDMEVWVTRAPMPISLLGMTFLNRLASYEARSDRLILRW